MCSSVRFPVRRTKKALCNSMRGMQKLKETQVIGDARHVGRLPGISYRCLVKLAQEGGSVSHAPLGHVDGLPKPIGAHIMPPIASGARCVAT